MSTRLSSIIGWIATALVAFMNIMAAVFKFLPIPPGSQQEIMGQQLGMLNLEYQLGVLEVLVIILFLIPRTSTVGFVLMTGYLGGALATNLTHGMPFSATMPLYISFLFLAISGWFRNPELTARLRGKKI